MLRKTILALTAIAALGATVSVPTTADAGWKKWKHHHHHFGHRRGFGFFGPALVAGALLGGAAYAGDCYERRWVETPYGLRKVRINVC